MKRLIALIIAGAFVAGCGAAARESEFWQHDTIYKNTDHLVYSWCGHKKCSEEDRKKSVQQDWWGVATCDAPGK